MPVEVRSKTVRAMSMKTAGELDDDGPAKVRICSRAGRRCELARLDTSRREGEKLYPLEERVMRS